MERFPAELFKPDILLSLKGKVCVEKKQYGLCQLAHDGCDFEWQRNRNTRKENFSWGIWAVRSWTLFKNQVLTRMLKCCFLTNEALEGVREKGRKWGWKSQQLNLLGKNAVDNEHCSWTEDFSQMKNCLGLGKTSVAIADGLWCRDQSWPKMLSCFHELQVNMKTERIALVGGTSNSLTKCCKSF